jgi:hypothetical protein
LEKAAHRPSGGSGDSVEYSLALLQAFVDSETREQASATLDDIGAESQREAARSLPANEHNVARAPGGEQGRGGGSAAPPGDPPVGPPGD